jgi:NAD-dependent SIR2 family protein deacetylase
MDTADLEHAAALLQQADLLIIAAGAGMGVDSGLPDFRGNDGFWQAYPALGRARMAFTSVASPATFHEDPALAWGFYGHRLNLYRDTQPHVGFTLLKRWGERMQHGAAVFTSNVDGHFQKAGFDPQRILECHGSIHHLQCLTPCGDHIWSADGYTPQVDTVNCQLLTQPPTCPHCGALARPNILMFGDSGWIESRASAQEARLHALLHKASKPLVIELGAGVAIPSVRHFGQSVIRHHNGRMIGINPREPQVASPQDVGLAANALMALSAIDALL